MSSIGNEANEQDILLSWSKTINSINKNEIVIGEDDRINSFEEIMKNPCYVICHDGWISTETNDNKKWHIAFSQFHQFVFEVEKKGKKIEKSVALRFQQQMWW